MYCFFNTFALFVFLLVLYLHKIGLLLFVIAIESIF